MSLTKEEVRINGIACSVFKQAKPASEVGTIAVFLHGYCATKEDLARTLFEKCALSLEGHVAAVFPQAPVRIENDKWAKTGSDA
jgi:hypothetical protein